MSRGEEGNGREGKKMECACSDERVVLVAIDCLFYQYDNSFSVVFLCGNGSLVPRQITQSAVMAQAS